MNAEWDVVFFLHGQQMYFPWSTEHGRSFSLTNAAFLWLILSQWTVHVCVVATKLSPAYSCSYTTCPELLYRDLCNRVSLSLQFVLVSVGSVCARVCVRPCAWPCVYSSVLRVCKSNATLCVSPLLITFSPNVTITSIVWANNLAKCVCKWEKSKQSQA